MVLNVPAPGEHFAENALGAWIAAVVAGADKGAAAKAISTTPRPPGRFDLLHARPNVLVEFAHTPDGIWRILKTVGELTSGRIIAVFEAGGNKDKTKRPLMGATAAEFADRIILTSDNPRRENAFDITNEILSGISDKSLVRVILDRKKRFPRHLRGCNLMTRLQSWVAEVTSLCI